MSLIDEIELFKKLPVDDDYAEDIAEIDFFNLSYEANGIDYTQGEAPDGPIIHKLDCEEKSDYINRTKQTPSRGYVSTILNKYTSAVFRNEPTRTISNDTLLKDADLNGTPLNTLMKKATKIAQIEGISYLLADNTIVDGEIRTIAQAQQSGQRSFIRVLKRESVLNYVEADETIIEALVLLTDEFGKTFVKYYNDQQCVDITVNDRMMVEAIGQPYYHNFSGMPLIKIEPFDSPQSESISHSQRTIINTLSLLKQEETDQTFTRWVISGVRVTDDQQKITWGSKRIVTLDTAATVNRIGADKSQADSLRESIKAEEDSLYYQAGFGRSNVADQTSNVSGVALLIQREDFFNICHLLKLSIEGAENKILALIADLEGFSFVASVYSDKYIADDNGEALARLRDTLSLALPPTFKKLMIQNYINQFYNVSDSDALKIEEELNNL
jgi:hypothetical protein